MEGLGSVAAAGAAAGVLWTRFPCDAVEASSFDPATVSVALAARLDGRLVPPASPGGAPRLDRTHVLVLDGLVDESTRLELLAAILGPGGDERAPAPPEPRWARATADADGGARTWGLTAPVLERLLEEPPPAVARLGARLAALWPGCDTCLLPSRQLTPSPPAGGGDACPVLANAPVAGDSFAWHADADPVAVAGGTPWARAYGAYANGDPGRPLLLTLVVYLSSDWSPDDGGETAFMDAAAGVGVVAAPRPGRVALFDADLLHRLHPPSPAACRPRYSLAWRLAVCERRGGAGAPSLARVARALGAEAADLGSAASLAALVARVGRERASVDKGGG
jgi:hypothetical protein